MPAFAGRGFDAQRGLAHFLEHMVFRGSKNVPENEVWPSPQRLGLAMGANASTNFTNTLYEFNFPGNDAASVACATLRITAPTRNDWPFFFRTAA
jgi:zinc protease